MVFSIAHSFIHSWFWLPAHVYAQRDHALGFIPRSQDLGAYFLAIRGHWKKLEWSRCNRRHVFVMVSLAHVGWRCDLWVAVVGLAFSEKLKR